ncbi:moco-containing subunit of PaoABC aldehyde oxidoreductase [Escherichia coli O145:H28]|nr:moco-containing subunit of PaoABC aldehyde oxidoreductase [Escherichia coli O145:H28]
MKFDKPAGENPIDQLKVVGRPHDRIDGPLKTTGTARHATPTNGLKKLPTPPMAISSVPPLPKDASPPLIRTPRKKRRAYWLSLPPVTPGHSAKATKTPPGC